MVYGSEAILPTNLNYGAPRVRAYNEQGAEASLEDAMDQLDEAPLLGQVPASVVPVPQPSSAGLGLQRRGPGALPHLEQ